MTTVCASGALIASIRSAMLLPRVATCVQRLSRIDHVGAVHGGTVMAGDARPQLDRIGFAVGADLGQGCGQQRLDRPFAVKGEQRLDDMLGDDAHHVLRRHHVDPSIVARR